MILRTEAGKPAVSGAEGKALKNRGLTEAGAAVLEARKTGGLTEAAGLKMRGRMELKALPGRTGLKAERAAEKRKPRGQGAEGAWTFGTGA